MNAVYSYTIKKYLKSYSTWVILVFSAIILGFVLGGIMPFIFIDVHKPMAASNYSKAVVATVAGITVFFAIFSAIFAGFKSSHMYKDEVENGTFLVVLSKPMRRSQIIFGKWFALQTVLIFYAGISVLFLCIGITIFDNGDKIAALKLLGVSSLKHSIWYTGVFIFLILYLTSLIFSSIGIMISTRLSTGSTIGITIAIGIYIPISGLLGMFLRKPEVQPAYGPQTRLTFVASEAQKALGESELFSEVFPNLKDGISSMMDSSKIYNGNQLGFVTGDNDTYPSAWWLDIDYQFKILASFAFEKSVPSNVITSLQNNAASALLLTPTQMKIKKLVSAQEAYDKVFNFITDFSKVSDDLASASVYKTLIDLQPLSTSDFENYFLDPKTSIKWGSSLNAASIVSELLAFGQKNNLKISELSINDIEKFFVQNKSLFGNNVSELLKDFLYQVYIADSSRHDQQNFLIKDDYKFPIPTSSINSLYDDIESEYQNLTQDKNAILDDTNIDAIKKEFLANNYSKEMADFISDLVKEYQDPDNIILDDSNQIVEKYKNIDYSFYKRMLYTIVLSSKSSTLEDGTKISLPVSDLCSRKIWLEEKMTEAKLRQEIYRTDWWGLWKDKGISSDANGIINSMQTGLNQITNPISRLYGNQQGGGGGSDLSDNVSVDQKSLATLRTKYEHGHYQLDKDANQNYADSTQDPITNLSQDDASKLKKIVANADLGNIATYSSKPYVDRNILISIYAVVAIALVPLTYYIVRRQDFR